MVQTGLHCTCGPHSLLSGHETCGTKVTRQYSSTGSWASLSIFQRGQSLMAGKILSASSKVQTACGMRGAGVVWSGVVTFTHCQTWRFTQI